MQFKNELIITGKERRTSSKTGNEYYLYKMLNETGDTFSAMSKFDFDVFEMEKHQIIFNLKTGRYLGLEVLDISNPIDTY